MTFKSYLEHTEAIFKELHRPILDIFKINNYTALFMFRYHHLKVTEHL